MNPRTIDALLEVMARLREPQRGCPWDVKQTFATIAPYTVEEAYEVADAIEREDLAELREELGDLLFQVVFHARMAEEQGAFAFADVVEAVVEKMVRRHPHVFGSEEVRDAEAQTRAWEAQKARERAAKAAGAEEHSALDGVARALPALMRAEKLQKRAARQGFDWPDVAGVLDKVEEELGELRAELSAAEAEPGRVAAELGDLLFTCVNLARHLDCDPETELRHTNARFERRFRTMEAMARRRGEAFPGLTADEKEALWAAAKDEE